MEIIRSVLYLALMLGETLTFTHHGKGLEQPALKVASFNIQAFGRTKTRSPFNLMVIKKVV
jgi:hypothetical protein